MTTAALPGPGVTERIEAQLSNLLTFVNEASASTRNGWIFFLILLAYFFVTLSGVTHQDLLLNSPVSLPILQVDIPQQSFFLFAPAVLVIIHFGVLMQHVMLSRKVQEFHSRLSSFEGPKLFRTHRLRVQLHSYFFSQAMAGPKRSGLFAAFLFCMSWTTLGLIPLLLLLYFQVTYLPYHDWAVTAAHRAYLVADFFILLVLGIFVRFPQKNFSAGLWENMGKHPGNFSLTLGVSLIAIFFSFCVATLPDSRLDRIMTSVAPAPVPYGANGEASARFAFLPTAYLFEHADSRKNLGKSGLFSRNLIVNDADLVPDQQWEPDETSLVLRGRDLRYAILRRTDLHRADLTLASLDWAQLSGANLSGATMRSVQMVGADLTRANLQNADLDNAVLNGLRAYRADFRGSNLARASLMGAVLNETRFEGATLKLTDLKGAELRLARLQGANFEFARLAGTDLTGAAVAGTNFSHGDLQWTNLPENLDGATFTSVNIWQTKPPLPNSWQRTYYRAGAVLASVSKEELSRLRDIVQSPYAYGLTPVVHARIKNRLRSIFNDEATSAWKFSKDYQTWQAFQSLQALPPQEMAKVLAGTVCRDGSTNGYVLRALVQRLRPDIDGGTGAIVSNDVLGQFFGDVAVFVDGIERCGAHERVPPNFVALLREFARLYKIISPRQQHSVAPEPAPTSVITSGSPTSP